NPLVDEEGELYGAVASYDDVTLRVEADRRTRHEADTDPLTGLANRRALELTLAGALARAGARGRAAAVLMLDLDGFKAINDAHAARGLCAAMPYTPGEYAAKALRIVDEGGVMIHIHARRPDGTQSIEIEDIRAITDAIRSSVDDVIINSSTGTIGVAVEK